jgi:hypothetical protein
MAPIKKLKMPAISEPGIEVSYQNIKNKIYVRIIEATLALVHFRDRDRLCDGAAVVFR